MPTEETEFWLYLSQVNEHAVKKFVSAFEQKHESVKIEINKINAKDAFFRQADNVIISELGEIHSWQLALQTSVEYIAYLTRR